MSKNLTVEDVQKIIYAFIGKKIGKTSPEYKSLIELLRNHPKADEKIGSGVEYFWVQQSKYKINQFNFMIRRTDGSSTDFSYIKCLNPTRKAYKDKNWNGIFREIIKEQVSSFRNSAFEVIGHRDKFICSHTNLKFKKIYSHVDHVYPLTFESIMLEFITLHDLDLDKIELSEDVGTSERQRILDENITKAFSDFHKKRAVLRIVCGAANLQSKKTKNYAGEDPDRLRVELVKKYPQYRVSKKPTGKRPARRRQLKIA